MTYIQALDYVLRKGYTAYAISKRSTLTISSLNRMLEQTGKTQERNKKALIAFVEQDIDDKKEDDRDVFLDRLEEEIEDNLEALKKRGSFRKLILIEVLKVLLKAQNSQSNLDTEVIDFSELVKKVNVDAVSSDLFETSNTE